MSFPSSGIFLERCSVVAGAKLTIAATKTPLVAYKLPESKSCFRVFFVTYVHPIDNNYIIKNLRVVY